MWGGGLRKRRHKKNLGEQKEDRGLACLEKTVTVGPGGGGQQTWLIPHLELVERNLMLALTSQHRGGSVGVTELRHRKLAPHLLHVKHKFVCDLPPEGHINILPALR